MPAKLTEEFLLYEQAWADAGIIIRTDKEVPEDRFEDFSLAVCKSVAWPPKKHIYRLEGEARERQLWDTIKHFRRTGATKHDGSPWDLEINIRKDPSSEHINEFDGIRFWVVYINQSC